MKTVPSLVASSTIGVAAAGLALGKLETAQDPSSKKRKPGSPSDVIIHNKVASSPTSRPDTSYTIDTPEPQPSSPADPSSNPTPTRSRPSSTRVERSSNNPGRRFSIIKNHEFYSPRDSVGDEVRRDSISSRGSWMRRLSTIPNSYNNSPRSSIGPDAPSIGSSAPILSPSVTSPSQTTPNKLVKRKTSERAVSGPEARSTSRSQVPTLRRPATSHQRSVTLKQQFRDDSLRVRDPVPSIPASHVILTTRTSKPNTPDSRHAWRSYFESRPAKLYKERTSGRSSDGGAQTFPTTPRRVIPNESFFPTLMKPAMITVRSIPDAIEDDEEILALDYSNDEDMDNLPDTTLPVTEAGHEVQKHARRSLSLQFTSPSTWIPRTGSLRAKKSPGANIGGQRNFSAPSPGNVRRVSQSAHGPPGARTRPKLDQNVFQGQPTLLSEDSPSVDAFAESFEARSRNTSSPLPPLTRLSSFNHDLARLGLSSSSSSGPRRSPTSPPLQINTAATSISSASHASSCLAASNSNTTKYMEVADRCSTLVGSDNDNKELVSGDDDETDFQSETLFDSLRSGATGSRRSHNPPLDSMFDESPPSVDGHSKVKGLSIHELLTNGGYHGSNRIVEEDEGMSTPVRGPRSTQGDRILTPNRLTRFEEDDGFPSSLPSLSLATKDFGRLSLDDEDEDEDWTKDEEVFEISHQLSPPSSSLNTRRDSPHIRTSLATALVGGGDGIGGSNGGLDRPKSSLFDWSEPSPIEKTDVHGNSARPKTAHVKQGMDERGGRFVGRRGPSAVHVRSQSVPVVPDSNDKRTKLIPKFGTWGLGAKAVSEDWDNDFDFENSTEEAAKAGDVLESSGMLVPPAIQASQESITGHVSQIREVCLLVEQLKRLRVLGKEKGLLTGKSAPLWLEAEGIITLASASDEESKEVDRLPATKESSPEQTLKLSVESSSEDERAGTSSDDGDLEESSEDVRESVEISDDWETQQIGSETEAVSSNLMPQSPVFGQFDNETAETESVPRVHRAVAPMANALSQPHTPLRVLNRHGQSMGVVYDGKAVHRQSVFSPDDDIFGITASTPPRENLKPPPLTPRSSSAKSSQHYARSLMETMHQQRAASDPLLRMLSSQSPTNKLPFDTTSLRELVQRANTLVRTLSDLVRKVDGSASPDASPHRDSSPAFTRVFTDPSASPPKHMPRSQSNNTVLNGSIEASPTRSLGQRMHMMTVV